MDRSENMELPAKALATTLVNSVLNIMRQMQVLTRLLFSEGCIGVRFAGERSLVVVSMGGDGLGPFTSTAGGHCD
jgi:hypothetical protein